MTQYIGNKIDGKFVFLSSSNVYDGALNTPHYEDDPTNAQTPYGKFKIECEKILNHTIPNKSVIIRIPEVYGKECPRLNRLKMSSATGETVETYQNFFVNYTTDQQIADWIQYILQHNMSGIFHIGTEDMNDYYEFQVRLAETLQIPSLLFSVEKETEKQYQAVLPHRKDIPDWLRFNINDVVNQMK